MGCQTYGSGVDEESDHGNEQKDDESTNDVPLVVVPDNVPQ